MMTAWAMRSMSGAIKVRNTASHPAAPFSKPSGKLPAALASATAISMLRSSWVRAACWAAVAWASASLARSDWFWKARTVAKTTSGASATSSSNSSRTPTVSENDLSFVPKYPRSSFLEAILFNDLQQGIGNGFLRDRVKEFVQPSI